MDKKMLAGKLFTQGYNCCQAVCCAFLEQTGMDGESMLKIASAFGGGFARSRGQCGAVSAMGIVLGLAKYNVSGDINQNNGELYRLVQQAVKQFNDKNKTVNCFELLKNVKDLTSGGAPDKRTEEYYKVRPCCKFVMDAAEILQNML